jgi:HPt (histidine-containing phosphotransfer) domain-containing protein
MNRRNNLQPDQRIVVHVDQNMKEIIPEFLQNSREDVQVLLEALERNDYETIRRIGHGMKGACGFGFDYLQELGSSLEQTAKAGNSADARRLINELAAYLERVKPIYE